MISIARGLDEFDIAQEVRLARQVHKGCILLLEGQTDLDRFDAFIDPSASHSMNCYGKSNAVGAIELLSDEGFPGVVAVVDADFDRIASSPVIHENIIYSASHDLDLDWFNTGEILSRYVRQVGNIEQIQILGGVDAVRSQILSGLHLLSVLRFTNHVGIVKFKLQELRLGKFYRNFSVDLDLMVEDVFVGRNVTPMQLKSLADVITKHARGSYEV